MRDLYHFSEEGDACIITDVQTPRLWYNYLWNENGYCAQVSQTGQGRSYYVDFNANMCRLNQGDARHIFLRDEETREFWNIGTGPSDQPVDSYRCEHRICDSWIFTEKADISASWQIFVPEDCFHEMWRVRIENRSERKRKISLFSVVSFELEGFDYPRYYEMYRCLETSFEKGINGIYCHSSHPFAPHSRYQGFLASSREVSAYDGDLTVFCGPTQTRTRLDTSPEPIFTRPRIVAEGRDCTGSSCALFIPGAALQYKLQLSPGESVEINFAFGVCESKEEAQIVREQYLTPEGFEREYKKTRQHLREKYGTLSLVLPDKRLNQLQNWIKKQVDFCIVGKKGVRDNLQIAVALLSFRPEKAREEILECVRHQFKEGHAVLTWYPYDDTRYSDQPFWIIWAVCALIRETGDFSLLDQELTWQDGGSATLKEHVLTAARELIREKGPHGLIKLRFADWNDALNVTTDPEAESVMLSEQACLGFRELSKLLEAAGDLSTSARMKEEYETLKRDINEKAWDGAWYVRVLTRSGVIGGKESKGSRIYLNPQVWAILAGIVPEERLQAVIKSIDGMEGDFGFPLNSPPYGEYLPEVGRMSGMLPGLFENGGVYCHASAFKVMADCALGRGEEALRTIRKIMPDSSWNPSEQSGAEPFVFTNCYGTHPKYYGKSYQSWTTGTSAWVLRGITEGLLGVRAEYAGLAIRPCLPREWNTAQITRTFRGAQYQIHFRREKTGEPRIFVDGEKISGSLLPPFQDGKRHQVEVMI